MKGKKSKSSSPGLALLKITKVNFREMYSFDLPVPVLGLEQSGVSRAYGTQ